MLKSMIQYRPVDDVFCTIVLRPHPCNIDVLALVLIVIPVPLVEHLPPLVNVGVEDPDHLHCWLLGLLRFFV